MEDKKVFFLLNEQDANVIQGIFEIAVRWAGLGAMQKDMEHLNKVFKFATEEELRAALEAVRGERTEKKAAK